MKKLKYNEILDPGIYYCKLSYIEKIQEWKLFKDLPYNKERVIYSMCRVDNKDHFVMIGVQPDLSDHNRYHSLKITHYHRICDLPEE